MAMRPRCIILDEPTAMLDPNGRKEVLEAVRELNRKEKSNSHSDHPLYGGSDHADRFMSWTAEKL